MSAATKIEWATHVWNPVRGCSRVSEGCRNCYAERQAARFSGSWETEHEGRRVEIDLDDCRSGRPSPFHGFATNDDIKGPRWTGRVELIESKLREPLSWRKPRERVFVNSMSDLFHESLSDEAIDRVFAVMALCPSSTFLVLTKRAERMREYLTSGAPWEIPFDESPSHLRRRAAIAREHGGQLWPRFPLPNVWLGVSVEDQATADERVPHLLETPAALRFVSYEPALGPVDFNRIEANSDMIEHGAYSWRQDSLALDRDDPAAFPSALDWIIVGGESGPGARPFDVAWARSVVEQGKAAGVLVFVKQLGAHAVLDPRFNRSLPGWSRRLEDRKGADPSEWPEDLRVRQLPEVAS